MNRTLPAALALLLAAAGCRGRGQDPLVTYFNGEHLLSVRYPASWRAEDGAQEGVWYRHFQGPPGSTNAITVTALAGPTAGSLDQYAQSYLGGNPVSSTDDASRHGVTGKRWRYASADGSRRFGLVLLQEGGHVWGLHSQGTAAAFDEQKGVVEEMEKSLAIERPAGYPQHAQPRQGFAIRVPSSWREGQNFSTGGTYLMQFISPPLAAEKRQTLHASLTVNVEPAPGDGTLDTFYTSLRQRLGEAPKLLTEVSWRGGRVALFRVETPLAVARAKKYFWISGGRGYSITCEAREDVFSRVTRWCDVIAGTLVLEGRPLPAEVPLVTPSVTATTRPPLMAR